MLKMIVEQQQSHQGSAMKERGSSKATRAGDAHLKLLYMEHTSSTELRDTKFLGGSIEKKNTPGAGEMSQLVMCLL